VLGTVGSAVLGAGFLMAALGDMRTAGLKVAILSVALFAVSSFLALRRRQPLPPPDPRHRLG
jgi:hypothetical protein